MELERIRTEHELTQKQLGDLLGVSDNTISQWETGIRQPRAEMIKRIARVLGCTPNDLLGFEEDGGGENGQVPPRMMEENA